ncbi:MAG: CdaR family protein, partial [Synergistaceae bacterium]
MKNKYYLFVEKLYADITEYAGRLSKSVSLNGDSFIQTRIVVAALSLFISIVIWAFVAWDGNSEGTRNMSVQIQYSNLPRGYSIFAPTKTIDIRLSGRINAISGVEESDVTAVVDMEGLQTGKYNLPIKIEVPPSVRLRSWNPSVSEVEIYRHIDRTIPLTWKINGDLPEGLVISKVELYPEKVMLSGPESDVLDVQSVNAVIPTDKLLSKEEINVELEIADYDVSRRRRINLSPGSVKAKIFLEEEMSVEKIPVKVS